MKRLLVFLMPLLLLAGCVAAPEPPPPATPSYGTASLPSCRIGPDGAPPIADRGIGGTGEPAARRADRGIGGTGGPLTRSSDRGIGGTGITGIVTGFASVCIDGLEVGLDDQVPIDIDGAPEPRAALRAGQMVAINAGPPNEVPHAARISVRHEVSGPVEAVLSVDPGLIVVAGQRVRVPVKTMGSVVVQPGVWLAVSGLRGPDGDIVATRLDPRSSGRILVHGPLIEVDGVPTIGSLEIRGVRGLAVQFGTYVVASGTYDGGVMDGDAVAPDLLVSDPPAYFGRGTKRLVLESYARFASGIAATSGGFRAGLAHGLQPPADLTGPVILSLDAQPDGSFIVRGARGAARGGASPAGLSPASERSGGGAADARAIPAPAASSGAASPAPAEAASPGLAPADTSMMAQGSGVGKASAAAQWTMQPASPAAGVDGAALYVRPEAAGSSGGVIAVSQPLASGSELPGFNAATTASDYRAPVRGAAQATPAGTTGAAVGLSAANTVPAGGVTANAVVLGAVTQGSLAQSGSTYIGLAQGGAVRGGSMSGGVVIQSSTPGALVPSGGGASAIRTSGIRLVGAGIAHPAIHGATGIFVPRVTALHLSVRPVRIAPRH